MHGWQDFPWVLPSAAPIAFTSLDAGFYAPVKNSRAEAVKKAASGSASGGAAAGEYAVYAFHRRLLALAGASLPALASERVGGIALDDAGARVVLGAAFRPTVGTCLTRLSGGAAIRLSARSSLWLDGDISVQALTLDGALTVRAAAGATVVIRRLRVVNGGAVRRELDETELASDATPEVARLRGYTYEPLEVRELTFDVPGQYVIDEA